MELFLKLFYINFEGLGWKIIFYILIILIPLLFWFKENRYQYKNFVIREVSTKEFNKLKHEMKVELQYTDKSTSTVRKIWIFGSNDYPSKIGLFEYDSDSNMSSKFDSKSMEKSYKQIGEYTKLYPETFVAFDLTTTEGFPMYRIKIEMNGMISWVDIKYQLRYDVGTNKQDRIKFRQTFISFLKSKING